MQTKSESSSFSFVPESALSGTSTQREPLRTANPEHETDSLPTWEFLVFRDRHIKNGRRLELDQQMAITLHRTLNDEDYFDRLDRKQKDKNEGRNRMEVLEEYKRLETSFEVPVEVFRNTGGLEDQDEDEGEKTEVEEGSQRVDRYKGKQVGEKGKKSDIYSSMKANYFKASMEGLESAIVFKKQPFAMPKKGGLLSSSRTIPYQQFPETSRTTQLKSEGKELIFPSHNVESDLLMMDDFEGFDHCQLVSPGKEIERRISKSRKAFPSKDQKDGEFEDQEDVKSKLTGKRKTASKRSELPPISLSPLKRFDSKFFGIDWNHQRGESSSSIFDRHVDSRPQIPKVYTRWDPNPNSNPGPKTKVGDQVSRRAEERETQRDQTRVQDHDQPRNSGFLSGCGGFDQLEEMMVIATIFGEEEEEDDEEEDSSAEKDEIESVGTQSEGFIQVGKDGISSDSMDEWSELEDSVWGD